MDWVGFEPATSGSVVAFKAAALFISYVQMAKMLKENLI
jgi:hypothetical protein